MNQIFNFSRFFHYARYQTSMNRRSMLLTVGGASVALFLFLLFFMRTTLRWDQHHWPPLFMISAIIGGLLFIGNSFGYLRKKESTLNTLMLPASVYEKYIYEYMGKVVLYTVLYPILFYIVSIPVVALAEFIRPERIYASFSFDPIFSPKNKTPYMVTAWVYFFASSLIFAGATAFKKYPLVKSLVFVGAIFLIGFSYVYLSFQKLHLNNGMQYLAETFIGESDTALIWLYWILGISAITSLVYGFFKLKEKEVS